MIVGLPGDPDRPARRRHLGEPQAARGSRLPGPVARAARRPPGTSRAPPPAPRGARRADARSAAGNAETLADPSAVSIVIPAYNEAAAIADVVALALGRRSLARDHRGRRRVERRHAARARRPRAQRSCAIPTTKATARRSRPGSAPPRGEYVMIVDGDGQHQGDDALRLAARLGEYDLVIGAALGARRRPRTRGASATGRSTGSRATSPGARSRT